MTYYAEYDSTAPEPQEIIGWYDTDFADYNLPPKGNLIEIPAADWVSHLQYRSGGLAVIGGKLTQHAPMPSQAEIAGTQAALARKAGLTIKCPAEPALNGVYSVLSDAQTKLANTERLIEKTGAFPGTGATAMAWPDVSGALHVFTSMPRFAAFATAVMTYAADLDLYAAGISTAPPVANVVLD
jgi:hypothetical protein